MLSSFRARFATSIATWAVPTNVLPRTILSSQSRLFLTSARLQFPAKKTSGTTKATASKPKASAKKKPAKKAAPKKEKKPVKRVAAKPSFDSKLMKPPKRALSPYFVFLAERMRLAKPKDLKEGSVVLKQVAEEWKNTSESAKQVYVEKSVLERAEYLKAYESWYTSLPSGYFREINKRRVAKGKPKLSRPKTLPKSPATPWVLFLKDYREKNGKSGRFSEYLLEARDEWRALSDAQKEVYRKQYRDAREEHLKLTQNAA